MIDRSRPNLFFRRGTWLAAVLLSLALAVVLSVSLAPARLFWLAALPLAAVAAGFVAVAFVAALLGPTIGYALWRIGYCCPRCRRELPPRYRCPGCGTLHDDLRPGPWGLWTARCGVCRRPLATTDAGGRASYARFCGNGECGRALPVPVGIWPEYHVALVGRDGRLLVPVLRRFEEEFARPNHITLSFPEAEDESAYRAEPVGEVRRLTVGLQAPNGNNSLLYLSDLTASGPTERYRSLARLDGAIFVIEPPAGGGDPAAAPAPARRRFSLALAVLVRTADTRGLPVTELAGPFLSTQAAADEAGRDRGAVRWHLAAAGLGPLVEGVERRFERVGYFATAGDPPRGLAAPLVWLLCKTGALTDATPPGRVLENLAAYGRRARRGEEGYLVEGGLLVLPFVAAAALVLWLCLGPWLVLLTLAAVSFGAWWAWFQRVRPRRSH